MLMLLFSNYARTEITTALVTHNLFQWPVSIHRTEKARILYLCPRLEFRDFFLGMSVWLLFIWAVKVKYLHGITQETRQQKQQ